MLSHKIEKQIVIHDEFSNIILMCEQPAQFLNRRLRLRGTRTMDTERTAGLGKPANRGDDLIEESFQKSLKDRCALWSEKGLNDGEISRKVVGKEWPLIGHAGTSIEPE